MIAVHTEATALVGPTTAPPTEPEDEAVACITPEAILTFIREIAAINDPRFSHLYRRVNPERICDSAAWAQQLLVVHRTRLGRSARGRRTGHREHTQAVSDLLDSANEATVELAWAALEVVVAALQHPDSAQLPSVPDGA